MRGSEARPVRSSISMVLMLTVSPLVTGRTKLWPQREAARTIREDRHTPDALWQRARQDNLPPCRPPWSCARWDRSASPKRRAGPWRAFCRLTSTTLTNRSSRRSGRHIGFCTGRPGSRRCCMTQPDDSSRNGAVRARGIRRFIFPVKLPPPVNPALVHHAEERANDVQNRTADHITTFAGSMTFVYLHIIWFSCWIGFGVEKYPFGLLTMIVSLEAIF